MSLKKTIIVADDDPGVLDSCRMILERAGYAVTLQHDGKRLLAPFDRPDLILLDKELSGLDGLDICRFLKDNESTRTIPVIMLSAAPQIDRMAISAGADGFIEKPFRMRHLLDVIAAHIQKGSADEF